MLAQIKPIGRSGIKQGIVIGTLVHDLLDAGVSEFVVNELCKEYRQSKDHTFFPDHDDFFHKAKSCMKKYHTIYKTIFPDPKPLALPPPEKTLKEKSVETQKMPWEGMTLETMPEDVKGELKRFCNDFGSLKIATIYCRSFNIDYAELQESEND